MQSKSVPKCYKTVNSNVKLTKVWRYFLKCCTFKVLLYYSLTHYIPY